MASILLQISSLCQPDYPNQENGAYLARHRVDVFLYELLPPIWYLDVGVCHMRYVMREFDANPWLIMENSDLQSSMTIKA